MQATRIGRDAAIKMHERRRQIERLKASARRRLEIFFGGATMILGLIALWLFWVLTPSGMSP